MGSGAAWDDPPPTKFFLDRMRAHDRVSAVRTLTPNRHDAKMEDGRTIKVFLTDRYTFSESDDAQLSAEYPEVTCIVSASSWNHFTAEARAAAKADGVGTFLIRDFMGAVHYRDDAFLDYAGAPL